ncbi:MAG: hypothetical protein IKY39_04530, partial [Clostridia bacterium]|nr:hypothetical protein [Clostridia bacterium]
SSMAELVNVVGYDVCAKIFNGGREEYCEDLNTLIGTKDGEISAAFALDPIGDIILVYLNEQDIQNKVITDLKEMNIDYEGNDYLKYLAEEYNIINELFEHDTSRDAYKLKDGPEYARSLVRLLIAMDDALCYYSNTDKFDDDAFKAVYNAVFAKIYELGEKLDDIMDTVGNKELPGQLQSVVDAVEQVMSIFENLPRIEEDSTKAIADVLTGREDEIFTVDSAYDNFLDQNRAQEYVKKLFESGNIDAITNMLENTLGISTEDIVDGLETFAEKGVEPYYVDSTDKTAIDEYKVVINGYTLILKRAFAM